MKKRILKSLSLCLALVLIAGVLFSAVALLGNPISMILAYLSPRDIARQGIGFHLEPRYRSRHR